MNPALIEFPDLLESERLVVRSPKPRDDEELHTAICETFDETTPLSHGGDYMVHCKNNVMRISYLCSNVTQSHQTK